MKNYFISKGYATAPDEDIVQDVVIVKDTRQAFSSPWSEFVMFDCSTGDFETDEDIDNYPDDYKSPYSNISENGIYHC